MLSGLHGLRLFKGPAKAIEKIPKATKVFQINIAKVYFRG